jgi:hypothetical protein
MEDNMHRLTTVALIFASACVAAPAQPGHCDALSNEKKIALTNYVRVKYKLPDSTTLILASDATISATCFHELTFQGVSPLKKWELKLYLSPDGRYLTSDLYDTTVDPVEEERRRCGRSWIALPRTKEPVMVLTARRSQ